MSESSFLQSILDDLSPESNVSIDRDIEELALLDYAIEAKQREIVRADSLCNTIQQMVNELESDTSFESQSSYQRTIQQVLLASGLDLPSDLFVSFEAAAPKATGEVDEKAIADDKSSLTKQSTEDPKEPTNKDDKSKKESKPKVDKSDTKAKVKETLSKIKEWLKTKSEEFTKWLTERAKRIGLMKKKVDAQSDAVANKLKGS